MKSIKKFSAMSAKDQPITESAKVTKEAVDELIKKIGFNSIDELKKEKDLLSKLEAMSKTFAKSSDISEDELEEDRAEDIEDEMNTKGEPKSLEGTKDKEGDEEVVASEVEEVEEEASDEIKDEVISDEQEITKEVPAAEDEVEDEGGIDVASEEEETPKATTRIMAFEDFIKEKETTVNKNINYRNDNEEEEDYAVPMAASADPLAEGAEAKGKEDEKEGDELEDKGDKKVDSEDDKEKADHYKGAVKSDDKQIDALKKDAKFDKEEEEDAEKNESTIMDFASFVNEAYDKVVFGGNKGDKSKTKEDEEDFEDEDKKDEAYDVVTLGGNKGDKSKTKKGEEDYEDDVDEDRAEDIEDEVNAKGKPKAVKESKVEETKLADFLIGLKLDDNDIDHIFGVLGSKSGSLDKILKSTKFYKTVKDHIKTIVSLANDAGYNAIKEGVGEVITKVEGDEIADEVAGADGFAIPVIKGDGPETAAGIAGDIMNKGKVKNLSALAGKLVTPDQKVTEVIPDSSNDVSEDGIEIPLVKEAKINEEDITSDDQFKEYATATLKKAFGDDYDETKATDVIDGLISKHDGDYGAMVGALQSSLG